MKSLFKAFKSVAKDESGATAIEYGLIAALIACAIIAGLSSVGGGLNGLLSGVSGKITTATPS